MSAALLILLLLFIMGVITVGYYASICIPIYLEDQKPVPVPNPEHEGFLPSENVPPVRSDDVPMNAVPPVKGASENPNPYPRADDLDEDAEMINPVQGKLTLDEPDEVVVIGDKKARNGASMNKEEKEPLLAGDDEDGLMVSGKKPVIVAAVAAAAAAKKKEQEEAEKESPKSNGDQVVVNMAEPTPVPAEQNIQSEHPVSHVVVSMPQAMSASMPVYDETSEEPTCTSVQEQHLLATLKKQKEADAANYGWTEEIKEKAVSNASLSKKSCTDSDTSDAEVTSYSFTKDEIDAQNQSAIVQEPNSGITMVNYQPIDESIAQSPPADDDNKAINKAGNEVDSDPECRRSPDGVSVKSLDHEEAEVTPPTPPAVVVNVEGKKKRKKSAKPVMESEIL